MAKEENIQRMKLDISAIKAPKDLTDEKVNNPNWRMIVGTFTGLK